MPLKLLILANCQASALAKICKTIVDGHGQLVFDVVDVRPSHEWGTDYAGYITEQLQACDVLLYQPHITRDPKRAWRGSEYWVSHAVNARAKLSFQSLYFSAYNPELSYLRGKHNKHLNEGFVDYHDKRIVQMFLKGESPDDIKSAYSSIQPKERDILDNLQETLQEMDKRENEQQLDIRVSEFIKSNYQRKRLFWTFNHPANAVLLEVVHQLLTRLNLSDCIVPEVNHELLKFDVFPVLPSVKYFLGLKFDCDTDNYLIQNVSYSADEIVDRYLSIYEQNRKWISESSSAKDIMAERWLERKKVFFHVGQSKTGTTSFQSQMNNNRKKLLDNNILYPETGRFYSSHMEIARHYSNSKPDEALIQQLVSEIKTSPASNIIISCESFEGLGAQGIARLRSDFRDFDVFIVNMLRERLDWAVSMYSEYVKKAAYISSFRRLVTNNVLKYSKWKLRLIRCIPGRDIYRSLWHFHGMLSDRKRVSAWLKHFEKSHVFVSKTGEKSVWKVFEELLGVDFSDLGMRNNKVVNAKPSILAIEVARRFYQDNNIKPLKYPIAVKFLNKLESELSNLPDEVQITTPFSSEKQVKQFLEMYRDDDEWLLSEFGFQRGQLKIAPDTKYYNKKIVNKVYQPIKQDVASWFSVIEQGENSIPERLDIAHLHIGTEKTGSTSIQSFLANNRSLLEKQGVIFPEAPGEENHIGLACYAVAAPVSAFQQQVLSLLGCKNEVQHRKWKNKFQNKLHRELNNTNAEKAIFSSEHLLSRLQKKSEVQALKKALFGYFKRLKIIVYVRRQDLMAASLYNEALKSGSVAVNTFANIKHYRNNPFFQIVSLLELWGDVFGKDNIDVRIFDKNEFEGNDLIKDFCVAADIMDNPAFRIPEIKNKGLNGDTQRMLLAINAEAGQRQCSIYKQFKIFLIDHQNEQSRFPVIRPSRNRAKELVEMFSAENAELSENWLGGRRFSDDYSMYDENVESCVVDGEIYRLLAEKVHVFCNTELSDEKLNNNFLADAYRDLALLFEHQLPDEAYQLMEKAAFFRPEGKFIQQKQDEFRQRLSGVDS